MKINQMKKIHTLVNIFIEGYVMLYIVSDISSVEVWTNETSKVWID